MMLNIETDDEQILKKSGGAYLVRRLSRVLLFSYLIIFFWGGYSSITARLSSPQIITLLVSITIFLTISTGVSFGIDILGTKNARHRLNDLLLRTPIVTKDEIFISEQAWKETLRLPGFFTISGLASAILVAIVPTWIILIQFGGITNPQAVQIILGGFFSCSIFFLFGAVSLDRSLIFVRKALLPKLVASQLINSNSIRANPRIQFFIVLLAFTAAVAFGVVGYYEISAAIPLQNALYDRVTTYVISLVVLGAIIIALVISISNISSKILMKPLNEIVETLDSFSQGKTSTRSKITTSDDTASLIVRFNHLLDKLDVTNANLEEKVRERTAESTHRTIQLQASAQVAREAASLQDIETLLSKTVDMIAERFEFYHTGIFLLDDNREYAVLRAASSLGGKTMLNSSHRLPVGKRGIVGSVAFQNRSYVAMNVANDPNFAPNPSLPLTQSEAAFPLSLPNNVIGVLDIQSTSKDVFSQSDIEVLQTLADQIALAIQNTRLLAELRAALAQKEAVDIQNIRTAWGSQTQLKKKYQYSPLGGNVEDKNDSERKGTNINQILVPITIRGHQIGSISLQRSSNLPWSTAERNLSSEVAKQVGLALENARLLTQSQQRVVLENTISKITASLSRTVDPDDLLQIAVTELHDLPDVEEVSVFINPPGTGRSSWDAQ